MSDPETQKVIDEIAAERARQMTQEGWEDEHGNPEGWSRKHDDREHFQGHLARAAAAYAVNATELRDIVILRTRLPKWLWPWEEQWWNPKNPRRDLVRAAALIVAEIERLDRAAQ